MDVILKVLEGAKTGTKIAVKKDEFLIGRSQKCHLCAGSSSVSRHHCAITRKDTSVSINDLGSRNGTLVNGEKISGERTLSSGDEIGIGTLKLLVTITHGINNLKRPKVKNVAEAVDRAVAASDSSVGEEDITKWLLDAPGPTAASPTGSSEADANTVASETQTIRMDDTNAVQLRDELEKQDESVGGGASSAAADSDAGAGGPSDKKAGPSDGPSAADSAVEPGAGEPPEETVKTKKHSGKKKAPGKLPPRPHELGSKDSREAAMQALRNWNRRR